VGRAVFLAHTQREVAVVVEERGHVIVVDIDQDVGLLVAEPLLDRLVAFENRLPDRVVELVRILGEGDGGSVRRGDAADDGCHDADLSSHPDARRPPGDARSPCMMACSRALRQVNFRIHEVFTYPKRKRAERPRRSARPVPFQRGARPPRPQLRCLETAAVILNIEIWPLPITAPSLASGLIMRLSLESCRLFALM